MCCKERHNYHAIPIKYILKYCINYGTLHLLFMIIDHMFIYTGGSCDLSTNDLKDLSSKIKKETLCTYYGGDWIETIPDSFCSIAKLSITDAQVCRGINGHWKGGFDISGHFVYLVNNCFILLNEIGILNYVEVDLENQKTGRNWFQMDHLFYFNAVCLFVILVWTYLTLITSVFFHTITEKGLGLVMSYTASAIIYHTPVLRKYI